LGEASSGAKFPIQADFLVQPGRDAINYEAKWNHWLVEEVANLCKEAIEYFKKHEKWKYKFLPAFDFKKSRGIESYDKLFGPKLIEHIEGFLERDNCVPTMDGEWARPAQVVRLTEDHKAREELVSLGILNKDEIVPVMGCQSDLKLLKGGEVFIPELPPSDPILKELDVILQKSRPVLHPDILGNTDSEDDQKVLILGEEIGKGSELWVLTKDGEIKPAKEVLFSKEFKPEQDWETRRLYISGLNFINLNYITDINDDDQLKGWCQFFKVVGVKDDPDNGVEEFAMKYAIEKLRIQYTNVTSVDKRNFGYDLEAETDTGKRIYIEVKGLSSEKDVELTSKRLKPQTDIKRTFTSVLSHLYRRIL